MYQRVMESVGLTIDSVGVFVIVVGTAGSMCAYLVRVVRRDPDPYARLRRSMGRAILLGLEFLVAGDIIRTVAVAPTVENVVVLGVIVAVRTFLSVSLQVELEGRWPWESRRRELGS